MPRPAAPTAALRLALAGGLAPWIALAPASGLGARPAWATAIGIPHDDDRLDATSRSFILKRLAPARKPRLAEARRGTVGPTDLIYTLGKYEILRRRETMPQAREEQFTLTGFHDRLLGMGRAPLAVVRAAFLEERMFDPPSPGQAGATLGMGDPGHTGIHGRTTGY